MSQRLFNVSKVGLFLDQYKPGIEKRKGEEVKVLKMTFRVAPLDAKLATAVDDGVGEESNVRATLFKLAHPDPKPHLERVAFTLGCPRQNLHIFASPDTTDSRLMLDQVRISDVYARTQKDANGYVFVFTGTYGPAGRDDQEFIHDWFRSQRFVTFEVVVKFENGRPATRRLVNFTNYAWTRSDSTFARASLCHSVHAASRKTWA